MILYFMDDTDWQQSMEMVTGRSPSGLHHLLSDVVKEVPATEGKGGLQERQGDVAH